MVGTGEIAAFVTAFTWALSALFFGLAGRLIGSAAVNLIRLVAGLALLLGTMLLFNANWSIPTSQAVMLGLSGFFGLVIGDMAYFEALKIMGPRRGSLMMTLAPPVTALLQVFLLNEPFGLVSIVGMVVTLGGVLWVVNERAQQGEIDGNLGRGILLGALGAAMQALGIIFAKAGMGEAPAGAWLVNTAGLAERAQSGEAGQQIDALYGTFIRMVVATAAMLLIEALRGRIRPAVEALRHRKAMAFTMAGALVGPFIGVWLSLYAAANTNTAVAMTIISTSPVMIIPIVIFFLKEKVSWRAILGACIAIGGVAMLAFREVLRDVVG